LPVPKPRNGEILVRVQHAGVNPIDWKIGEGRMQKYYDPAFPLVVGRDLAGNVEAVGNNVSKFSPGDIIVACLPGPGGAFAEYVTVDQSFAAHAPRSVPLVELASVPLVGLTCWQALVEHGAVSKDDVVFILSGAGGTGSIAVQLAFAIGATVLTTCSPDNHEYVMNLGASVVYDYSQTTVSDDILQKLPNGVDIVFSNVLGDLHKQAYRVVRKGGKLVTIGEAPIEGLAAKLGIRDIDLVARPNGNQLAKLIGMMEDGKLRPPAVTTYPLDEGAQAFEDSMRRHTRGKIVLNLG
jgi:NADPH2:quinone reductase